MGVRGHRLRNRARAQRFQQSRRNQEAQSPQREPTRVINLKLVDSVSAYHTPARETPNSRRFEIARARNDGPEMNIITKFHGMNDGWAGVINNENSLMNLYQLMPSEEVTFFFAARFPRESDATRVQLNPGLIQLFYPTSTPNTTSSEGERLRNSWAWVPGWSGVISGNADSYEGLVQVFREVPSSAVSFVIAGNQ